MSNFGFTLFPDTLSVFFLMCGILGFVGANHQHNRDLIKALTLHLSLRGIHATGLAWLNDETGLRVLSAPVSAQEFWDKSEIHYGAGTLKVIAHTRYSTSDLRWNQPIADDTAAIVLNGVVSQEPPEKWPTPHANCIYATGNDAEVALEFIKAGQLQNLPGSWAICVLDSKTRQLRFWRNAYRPLWFHRGADFWVVSSTADSLLRCGLTSIQMVPVFQAGFDLQPSLNSLWPDLQCSI